ncbi:MAG: tetratricopeptide repeat protein [candidate division WOR-3 bacterium]
MKKNAYLLIFILILVASVLAQQIVPADARLRGGKIHFQSGRYQKALEQFELALKDFPDNAEVRFWKALTLEKMGRFIEAAENFDTTFTYAPEWLEKTKQDETFQYSVWNSFIKAGQKMEESQDYGLAIKFYRRATAIEPKNPQAFLQLSQVYTILDSLEEIRKIANSLYEIDPQNQQSNILLGLYFFRKEDWDSSLIFYQKAIDAFQADRQIILNNLKKELKVDSAQINMIAEKLIEKRNTRTLEPYINDSLKAKSKIVLIARLTDQLYFNHAELNICNFRAGVSALQKANAVKTESLKQQYYLSSINYFQEAIKYNKFDYDARFNIGMTYYRSGNDQQAELVFQELLQTVMIPLVRLSSALAQNLISLINSENLKVGVIEIAPPLLNEVDKEMNSVDTYKTGYWYLYYNNYKNAKEPPNEIKDDIYLSAFGAETIENLWLLLGAAQTNLKKYEDAIKAFNIVLDFNPYNQDAYRNLAVCYREKGDQKKAYEILQQGEKMKNKK